MKKTLVFILIASLILIAGTAVCFFYQKPPLNLETTLKFPTPRPVIDFSITDHKGKSFTQQHLKGKWTLLFAGYTSCPDICPTTMGKLTNAYPKLAAVSPFQIVFISVDPERDSQDKLNSYIEYFNPEFIAVTAGHAKLIPFTRNLGMAYAMVGEGENYLVDHSASLVLVSPKGERYAIVKPKSIELGKVPQIKTKTLISDITQIIDRY